MIIIIMIIIIIIFIIVFQNPNLQKALEQQEQLGFQWFSGSRLSTSDPRCVCVYVCMYVCMYIYIYTHDNLHRVDQFIGILADVASGHFQDSSKRGAVETGCSGLHYIIGCFVI